MTPYFKDIDFSDFEKANKGSEGIVLIDCGGEPEEWFNGVGGVLKEEGIAPNGVEDFGPFFRMKSPEGRTDLVMMFANDCQANLGKMAMWRLKFGDCKWVSDFIPNFRKEYSEAV